MSKKPLTDDQKKILNRPNLFKEKVRGLFLKRPDISNLSLDELTEMYKQKPHKRVRQEIERKLTEL